MRWTCLFLLALPLAAQQRGMYGGISTGQQVGVINDPGFASRLGATISGLPQTTTRIPVGTGIYSGQVRTPGNHWTPRQGRTVVVPYGVPFAMPYPVAVDYGASAPQPVIQQQPSVIINQYYTPDTVTPQLKEYDNLPPARAPRTEVQQGEVQVFPPAARQARPSTGSAASAPRSETAAVDSTKATITLLAFTDSTVVTAIAYWQQGDSLHYVTDRFAKRIVPLSGLDKDRTEQLNTERKVEFRLEAMR